MQLTVFTAANKHTRRTGRSRGRGVKMSESVSVFGGRVPAEVELLWKHLKNLKRDTFTQILRAVVDAVDGQDCCEAVREISESGFVSEESLNHVMAGLYALLKEALCLPALRQEVFNEDLRALRIPEEFLADVSSVVFGNRQTSMNVSDRHQGPSLAKLEEFKWRVDVAISTRYRSNDYFIDICRTEIALSVATLADNEMTRDLSLFKRIK
ncbi:COMM domain-containing protein 5 isoform X2 [Megalobrama amblycephala]|uniref:COMM domain-containing protein 5 isoform X2 n=1 Tax=Megalobrama amblycephala TaxID=75352 RepID=UPI0020140E94|nr:COMM domain-containing protein 5 isoform X2 [Megalobrama amblycephala]